MDIPIRTLFGLKDAPSSLTIAVRDTDHPLVPKIDSDHVFEHSLMRDVLAWVQRPASCEPLYLCGPTGAGKTSTVQQIAARLRVPVYQVTGHGRLEVDDLVGEKGLKNGDTIYGHGPLAQAMREGAWFQLDEIDLVDPATLAGLNGVLDGAPLTIAQNEGEVVQPVQGFRFIATGNTNGNGDDTGGYTGTLRQNLAFMDRFFAVQVDYLAPEIERELIFKRVPALNTENGRPVVASMQRVVKEVREAFLNGGESAPDVTFSTRTLVRWAHYLNIYVCSASTAGTAALTALDRVLGFKASPAGRQALHEILQRVLGKVTIETKDHGAGPADDAA